MKEKFISGIYNYCDRWCERCTFTTRCRSYERTSQLASEQLNMNNQAFWDNISDNFKEAVKLLHKAAEKFGFDLNTPMTEEEETKYRENESFLRSATKESSITKLCKQYQKIVMPFVEKNEGFTEKTNELVSFVELGIKSEDSVINTVAEINNCFEVIQWYLFFIDAKLQRALHGKLSGGQWEMENGFQKDSDGSAKIAFIAIEKSMGAWSKLYNLLPSSEDTTLKALSLLEQLKQKVKLEFPNAMEFKRPGFDDVVK